MQAIDAFEHRCVAYEDQTNISHDAPANRVFQQSHAVVYEEVAYMLPEHPPRAEMLAIMVKQVCSGPMAYQYVFEQLERRYEALVGDIGVSTQVIFYYVSNTIISLLVLRRRNSLLSNDILIKILQRFNLRDATLRAGIEVIAEEVLRQCFISSSKKPREAK